MEGKEVKNPMKELNASSETGGIIFVDSLVSALQQNSQFLRWQQSDENLLKAYKSISTISACVDSIASIFSKTNFFVHEILNQDGDSIDVPDHDFVQILYSPNNYQTKTQFISYLVKQILIFGRVFILKTLNDSGDLLGLEIVPAQTVTIRTEGGYIVFDVHDPSTSRTVTYSSEQISMIVNSDPESPLIGHSPVKSLSAEIFLTLQAQDYQAGVFTGKDILPSGYAKITANEYLDLTNKDVVGEYQKNVDKLTNPNKSGLPILINTDIIRTKLSPNEIDYGASVERLEERMLKGFRLSKTFLGEIEDANRSNMQEVQRVTNESIIEPLQELFVESLQKDLLVPHYGNQFVLNYESGYTQSLADKVDVATTAYQSNDIWTRDEAREYTGKEPEGIEDDEMENQKESQDEKRDGVQPNRKEVQDDQQDGVQSSKKVFNSNHVRRSNLRKSPLAVTYFEAKSKAEKIIKANMKRRTIMRGDGNRGMKAKEKTKKQIQKELEGVFGLSDNG